MMEAALYSPLSKYLLPLSTYFLQTTLGSRLHAPSSTSNGRINQRLSRIISLQTLLDHTGSGGCNGTRGSVLGVWVGQALTHSHSATSRLPGLCRFALTGSGGPSRGRAGFRNTRSISPARSGEPHPRPAA